MYMYMFLEIVLLKAVRLLLLYALLYYADKMWFGESVRHLYECVIFLSLCGGFRIICSTDLFRLLPFYWVLLNNHAFVWS